jgi:hypothetical protein
MTPTLRCVLAKGGMQKHKHVSSTSVSKYLSVYPSKMIGSGVNNKQSKPYKPALEDDQSSATNTSQGSFAQVLHFHPKYKRYKKRTNNSSPLCTSSSLAL